MKKAYILLLFAFLFGSIQLNAEGSVDFINYPGHRLFLRSDKDQQMKVYAKLGEYINVGSSHTGFDGGVISVYRPDGTLHSVFDGSDGSTGIIFNDIEELNGPTGAANNGYTPGVVLVTAATEGIWSVIYSVPDYTGAAFANLLNNAPWTRANDQPTNRRVITSWDVTVSESAAGPDGGNLLTGRVYANEYNSMINMNGVTTSPQFFVLTPDGLLYTVDFMETDPWGFPLSSSSLGLLNADQSPSYQSWPETVLERSVDPTTWQDGTIYQYEPQAEDYEDIINNKIFFNSPDVTMPTSALVTDVFRNNTHSTWLYSKPFVFEIIFNDFTITGNDENGETCNVSGLQYNQGAYFIFDTAIPGNVALELDINNDGDLDDPEDLVIVGFVNAGIDSIYWDGGDGLGNPIPVQDNFVFNYQFFLRGGENHIMLSDVENNTGGIVFDLLSDVGAVQTDLFYYDHTPVDGPVSGDGTPGNALATNVPFTYGDQFGNKKALDYWAYIVYNDTGGGSIMVDIVEDCTEYPALDTDGDGITDDIDLDDDNDGISDYLEYCAINDFFCLPGGFDPAGNEDGDPYLNYQDASDTSFVNSCVDLDTDGLCDFAASVYDTDGDGIINSLDLDSDNDGITDLFEANHGQLDADNNGMIDGDFSLFGDNGFFNVLASDPNSLDAVANYSPSDQDNDGVLDAYDLDTDNDGIYDIAEAGIGYADDDDDGRINNSPVVVDTFGLATSLNALAEDPKDKDADGVPDFRDLDSDNDTFLDVGENDASDPDNDGIIDLSPVMVTADGVVTTTGFILMPLGTSVLADKDGDGVPNFHDLDSDNDAINDVVEYWASVSNTDPNNDGIGGYGLVAVDGDGVLTIDPVGIPINSGSNPEDTDNDNLPDVWDLDSDNDGINDVEEGGHSDPDNDGIVGTGNPIVNIDGQAIEGIDGEVIASSNPSDTDNDNYPNYIDLDSDNDGINDVIEGGNEDPDGGGIAGTGNPLVNADGQTIDTTSEPTDTDEDGVADYIDLDSDNDGISDVIESGNEDSDNDGIVGTGTPVVNENGQTTGSTSNPVDTDNDGYPDYVDLDSDNDGINDVIEGGNEDPDGDGIIGIGTPVVNDNGQPNGSTSNPTDTDNDGYPDYIDLDSDNDAINDVTEGGQEDPDGDGIVGVGTPIVNDEGQTTGSNSDPVDTDEDGYPDYVDLDSDNDAINDVIEGGNEDPDGDGIVGVGTPIVNDDGQTSGSNSDPTDTDNDGYPDYVDLDSDNDAINDVEEGGNEDPDDDGIVGVGTPIVNENGQPDGSTSDPTDTDEDGMPDYVDLDSDSDNISDVVEGGNIDPDDDGIVGIGIPVVNENGQPDGSTSNPPDTDLDGNPDYQDPDSDGDGIVDIYECPDDNECVDTDMDGIPDFLDPDSDGDGINDIDECETGAPCVDTDMDGIPDYIDTDTDNDGLLDEDECVDGAPCPDTDMDGIPDWRDPLCEIAIEAIVGGGVYCEGENISLGVTTNVDSEEINFVWTNTTTGATFPGSTANDPGLTLVFLNANNSHSGNYVLSITTPADDCTTSSAAVFVNVIMTADTPTLTAENTVVCEGSTVTLNTNPNGGVVLTYQWFNGSIQVAETADPSLVIENFTAEQAGIYTVIAFNGDCPSLESNAIEITFVDIVDNITATNSTSAENPACQGSDITLNVPFFDGATVEWFGPNGTLVGNTFSIALSNITDADEGEYYAIITFEICGEITSSVTEIFVQSNNFTPELNADNDEVCAGQSMSVNVINDLGIESGDNVSYTWYNAAGEQVAVTSEGNYNYENIVTEGDVTVVVSINGCEGSGGSFYITVLETPNEFASIPQNLIYFCQGEVLEIQAVAASNSEGMWRSLGAATVLNPTNNVSAISGLVDGPNIFVWALSIELCGEFSTDTIIVYASANLQAFDDAAIVEQNERLDNMDASANDVIANSNGVIFSIIDEPQNGTASMTELGIYSYIPNEDYEGEDEFIYSLCSSECLDDCVTATVSITVNNTVFIDDCFVPNGITPNGDGANDVLEVPCLNDNNFPNNHIAIFNRWGDKVYEKTGYANDWGGTYKGKRLPAGTYFYILEIEPGSVPLQDFFTIVY